MVWDSGAGISEEDRPYIFDPFFTTKAVGVGMGLCRVKRIVSEHKGVIAVDGSLAKGTKVVIRLPRRLSENGTNIGGTRNTAMYSCG